MFAFLDSDSKVNIIHLNFAKELGLSVRLIYVEAQKINGTMLNTYKIVVAAFLVTDKIDQVRFFEKTFLVTNVSLEVVHRMLFLILSIVQIDFLDWKLW